MVCLHNFSALLGVPLGLKRLKNSAVQIEMDLQQHTQPHFSLTGKNEVGGNGWRICLYYCTGIALSPSLRNLARESGHAVMTYARSISMQNRFGKCADVTRPGHFFSHFGNPSMGRRYLHVYYTFPSRIPFYHASILSSK
jgi:hypothetical protein